MYFVLICFLNQCLLYLPLRWGKAEMITEAILSVVASSAFASLILTDAMPPALGCYYVRYGGFIVAAFQAVDQALLRIDKDYETKVHSYGPISLWPYIAMALYSYGHI